MAEQPRKVGVYDRVRETATHRRGGVPAWVWIVVALIILALLAWWASSSSDTARIPTTGSGTEATPAPTPGQPARQQYRCRPDALEPS
jgi:hypothetical protein